MRFSSRDQHRSADPAASLTKSQENLVNAAGSAPLFDRRSVTSQDFNDDALVRQAITRAIRACTKSREQIAEAMTVMLGTRVTVAMLNNFSAEAKQQHRWPAAWDRAFCQATGDDTLLVCRVQAAGLFVIDRTDFQLLELGREYLRQKRARERAEILEAGLRGVEL
jgi:hypothetical protein